MSPDQGTPTVDGGVRTPHGPRAYGLRGRAAVPGHRPHFDELFPTGEIAPTSPMGRREYWRLLRQAAFDAIRKPGTP